MQRLLVLLVLQSLMSFSLLSQEYIVKQRSLGVEDGLSSREMRSFLMDSHGIMWMGGGYGLDRYDGNRIINYNRESNQLKENSFHKISEDSYGRIWLTKIDLAHSNQFKVQIFDPVKKEANWWGDFINLDLLDDDELFDIEFSKEFNSQWIVGRNTVYQLNDNGEIEIVYRSQNRIEQSSLSNKGLWLGFSGGFLLIDLEGNVLKEIKTEDHSKFRIIGADSNGDLYYFAVLDEKEEERSRVYKNDRLFSVDGKYPWTEFPILKINPKQDLIFARNGDEFIAFDLSLNEVARLKAEPDFYKYPFEVYFDSFNNWWVPFDERVHLFKFKRNPFTNYLTNFFLFGEYGFGARGILPVDEKTVYVSGLGGTYVLDKKSGQKKEFIFPKAIQGNSSLGRFRRLAIAQLKDSLLIFSTEGDRLYTYNISTADFGVIKSLESQSRVDENIDMNWVLEPVNNRVWIGQALGIAYFNVGDSVYNPFEAYNGYTDLENAQVFDFYAESQDSIWVGSSIGLYLLRPENGIVKKANLHYQGVDYSQSVKHINQFGEDILFLATQSGILKYSIKNDSVTQRWSKSDGLSDNTCYAVYQDEFGRFWIPTNSGINLLDVETSTVQIFDQQDGISHNEFNTISHAQAADGTLYFGNLNGVTSFNPADFPPSSKEVNHLFISRLRFQNGDSGEFTDYPESTYAINRIELLPKHIGLEIQFGGFDYLSSTLKSFAYKIEGLDLDWVYNESPEVRINRLPYGTYALHIKAQDGEGRLYEDLDTITLVVLRPFYLQMWFVSSCLFLLFIAIYCLVKFRERLLLKRQFALEDEIEKATGEIKKQAEELRSLDKLKSNFFANISHELKTPLSLVLAPLGQVISSFKLEKEVEENLNLAYRNAESVKGLVNEILDLARLENGIAQPRYSKVKINSFTKRIVENFMPRANSLGISFGIMSNQTPDDHWILDALMTEKILNNLISNALNHTPSGGRVSVEVNIGQDLEIAVRDDGKGISSEDLPFVFDRFFQSKDPSRKASGGTGIGLALSNELAHVMDGELYAESKLNEGSVFTLCLPLVFEELENLETSDSQANENKVSFITSQFSILLVEDNDDLRQYIQSNLAPQFNVVAVNDGLKALDKIKDSSSSFDLIISDMMMPNMDGLELLQSLRSNADTKEIPFIFLTARTAERDKLEAFQLGISDYLTKPFSLEELKARVKNLLKVSLEKQSVKSEDKARDLSGDEEWLKRLRELTVEQMTSVHFSIGSLAQKMNESERTFYRKIKKMTGYSPNVFLREIRLQIARDKLERKESGKVSEVSEAVGFSSSAYFSKLFKERFGKPPAAYLE